MTLGRGPIEKDTVDCIKCGEEVDLGHIDNCDIDLDNPLCVTCAANKGGGNDESTKEE